VQKEERIIIVIVIINNRVVVMEIIIIMEILRLLRTLIILRKRLRRHRIMQIMGIVIAIVIRQKRNIVSLMKYGSSMNNSLKMKKEQASLEKMLSSLTNY
jgi:hypothetical protein